MFTLFIPSHFLIWFVSAEYFPSFLIDQVETFEYLAFNIVDYLYSYSEDILLSNLSRVDKIIRSDSSYNKILWDIFVRVMSV